MRTFPTCSPVAFKAALFLMLAALLAAAAQAAVMTASVTGALFGNQTLPQFNPANGTLTGVMFQLTSLATGQASTVGTLVPALPPDGPTCMPGSANVGITIKGFNSNLNTALTSMVNATGTPGDSCMALGSFSQAVNAGPTAGLGILSSYVGLGTLPFTFSITSATTATWTGTLSVQYSYVATQFNTETPEPGTWMMVGTALTALAWRKRRS